MPLSSFDDDDGYILDIYDEEDEDEEEGRRIQQRLFPEEREDPETEIEKNEEETQRIEGDVPTPLSTPSPLLASTEPQKQQLRKHQIGHRRVWRAATLQDQQRTQPKAQGNEEDEGVSTELRNQHQREYWTDRVVDSPETLAVLLDRIEKKSASIENDDWMDEDDPWAGGRMRTRHLGVLHQDPAEDMNLLTKNYTLPAVASALRDREDALQHAAVLAQQGKFFELANFLQVYHPKYVLERRRLRRRNDNTSPPVDVVKRLDPSALEVLRKSLMRMPRNVVSAHSKRAAVVIPLCTVNDGEGNAVPSILLEKRSKHMRSHPDEVCLPGGMVCAISDQTIVNTCLREMREEIHGLERSDVQVLGVFRCNWGEVQHMVGVAVTPVVCYLGELPDDLHPNPDEVAEVFTVPLRHLVDKNLWVHKDGLAPIFIGGPDVIWGLTGYILERFWEDILLPNSSSSIGSDEDANTE